MALLLLCPAATGFAGYYFESTATTEGAGPRGSNVTRVHAWVDGANAKIEFQSGDATGMFGAGTYILAAADSNTTYFVDPKEQTVAEINLDQVFGMVNTMLDASAGMVQLSFSDFSSEKLDEGPGEPILGYRTTRYKYRTAYTMSVKVLGMGRANTLSTENEFWCTNDIDADGFSAWLRPDRFRTGNADIDNLIQQQYAEVDCLPLRSHVVSTSAGERGRANTTTVMTEVTVLREESIPAATFEVPTGYTTTTLIPDFTQPGSTSAEPAAGEGGEGGRRPRLRDLLNR
jgi:hypothetical protein